jgi:hypothetical protein
MYISPTERVKKIHLWIGTTELSEKDYYRYFDQDEETSLFAKEIGLDGEYDEDFIGILPLFERQLPVIEILQNEVPLDHGSITQAMKTCNQLGINTANAVFYVTDSALIVEEPYKSDYNGLSYLGMFKSAL